MPSDPSHTDSFPRFCHRCGRELTPGEGNFYVVRIEAFADPAPPALPSEQSEQDLRGEIERLIDQMDHHSERELMDQVHRRLTLELCAPCYQQWIENPTG